MVSLLVTTKGQARERWCPAFPDAPIVERIEDLEQVDLSGVGSVWLDLSGFEHHARAVAIRAAVQHGSPVIVMVAVPEQSDAFAALQQGVQGYCHIKAAPEQLREIALVVEHGGLWMPPEVMQRFFAVSARVASDVSLPATAPALDDLTPRERMVAQQVARGASNREISASLDISERTVKSHLTVIFSKLGVRDRVQLALAMNNIPTCTAVE